MTMEDILNRYVKTMFTNGSGEPINDENLNHMQEQYVLGVQAAMLVKASAGVPAVIRRDILNPAEALEGEIYIIKNPSLEYEEE